MSNNTNAVECKSKYEKALKKIGELKETVEQLEIVLQELRCSNYDGIDEYIDDLLTESGYN